MASFPNIKKKAKNVFLNRSFIWSLMFFFLYEPAYFSQFELLHNFFLTVKLLVFFFLIILLVHHKEVPAILFACIIYYVILFFSTVINYGGISDVLYQALLSLGAITAVYLIIQTYPKKMVDIILPVFEILTFCNFVSILLAPKGLYIFRQSTGWWSDMCWFLGLRNGMTTIYILAAFFQILNYYHKNKSKLSFVRLIVFFVYTTISIIIINSTVNNNSYGTSAGGLILSWALVLSYFIFIKIKSLYYFLDFLKGVVFNYILAIGLVVFDIQIFVSDFLTYFLQKDFSLTGRIYIWDTALKYISNNWIIGCGYPKGIEMSYMFNNTAVVTTTHNGFLDVMFFGGILLSVSVILIFYFVAKKIRQSRLLPTYSFFFGYFVTVFLISMQTEGFSATRLFTLLSVICLYSPLLEDQKDVLKEITHEKI